MFTIYIDFSFSWAEFLFILTLNRLRKWDSLPSQSKSTALRLKCTYLSRLLANSWNMWKNSGFRSKHMEKILEGKLSSTTCFPVQLLGFGNYCATEISVAYKNHFNWKLANRETLPRTETSQYLKQIMMPKTLTCCFFFRRKGISDP